MNLIVWTPTLVIASFLAAGLLLTRNVAFAIAIGVFGLYSSASLATLAGIVLTRTYSEPIFLALALLTLAVSVVFSARSKSSIGLLSWIGILGYWLLGLASQILSRILGLSSVAFTDGHTLMMLARNFQDGREETLGGLKALKRGFALPALQSFGFPGEYLVGFLPLVFIAAAIMTAYLIFQLASNRRVFLVSLTVLAVIAISTEALIRHLYLMNTHAVSWLLFALFLVSTFRHIRGQVSAADLVTLIFAFVTIGFLRLDFVILFAPVLLAFILLAAKRSRWLAYGSILAVLVPLWLWLTFSVQDFPYLGEAGPIILVLGGLALSGVVIETQARIKRSLRPLSGWLFPTISALLAAATLVVTNVSKSLEAIFVNLFLGEGLWGATPLFLTAMFVVSLFARKELVDSDFVKAAIRLGFATLAVYLFIKFLDSSGFSAGNPPFARIGFGDSLNRTLITWLPIVAIPLVRAVSLVLGEGSSASSARPVDKGSRKPG